MSGRLLSGARQKSPCYGWMEVFGSGIGERYPLVFHVDLNWFGRTGSCGPRTGRETSQNSGEPVINQNGRPEAVSGCLRWSAVWGASIWGTEGPEFKSRQPDKQCAGQAVILESTV